MGGGCNARRCQGGEGCPCRRELDPMPCGCPVVVDELKGAHAEGCPYMAQVLTSGYSLIGWAQATGRDPWPTRG